MTTKTPIRKKVRSTGRVVGVKAVSGEPGTFEAIVSVFGNVDFHGDRIVAGAFEKSLERWAASGDPIPVIFSHQWDNLDAHIGEVIEAKELPPGAPELAGTGLEANGGLWTKFALELDEDFASRVAKKLTKRTLREFSFAYDVLEEGRGSDGANELLELEILEVGPTLKGANPATVLLSKALGEGWQDLDEDELLDRLAKALGDREEKARISVDFEGSAEDELEAIYLAALEHFRGLDTGNGGFYALHQEATFLGDDRAIVLVEGWDDPIGEGILFEVNFERDEETGELSVGEVTELEIAVDVRPKARSLKHRAADRKVKADPEGKSRAKVADRGARDEDRKGTEAIRLDLEIADLEISI